jgi:hypothetical protein
LQLLTYGPRLYGKPAHLDYIASALREKHGNNKLLILAAKRNSGSLTYDGIELGGERVAHEIEEAIDNYTNQGYKIKKLSLVGYSLGGLVARYAIGLLFSRGYFDKIQPVNFTTFVTPHVGVRSPARRNHFWNVLGARTISKSGRQLFMIDKFRDTGSPLLSLLAAEGSIFMLGLARFQRRCLYANIVNDRASVFYTTSISKHDPFVRLEDVSINYLPGYGEIVVDPDNPVRPRETTDRTLRTRVSRAVVSSVSGLPFRLFLLLFIPFASLLYLINAAIQTVRSQRRIRLHEEGKLGVPLSTYKLPLFVEEMRSVVEEMYETVNAAREPEYLADDAGHDPAEPEAVAASPSSDGQQDQDAPTEPASTRSLGTSKSDDCLVIKPPNSNGEEVKLGLKFPTLALTPAQFTIIDNLNSVGFRKYPVHIHDSSHSHAAIIVRMPKKDGHQALVGGGILALKAQLPPQVSSAVCCV